MPISRDTVEAIARLAHLELEEAEIDRMVQDMGAILAYVDRLRVETGANPSGEPGAPPPGGSLRPDIVQTGLEPGEATRHAPGARGDLFRVPPAIESDR
jgi:aspartyl-tRNA(Asn)/glutamyl-tRNA(Gln) amidotransferase subunit C